MMCPVCKNGKIYGKMYNRVGELVQRIDGCPHCRGTGEIQEGDWWMCEIYDSRYLDEGPGGETVCRRFRWRDGGYTWEVNQEHYPDEPCEESCYTLFKPLYRMERAG